MAPDFSTFQSRFGTFTGSLLRGIDLRELGLVVAGGSVLLCLQHNVQPTKVRCHMGDSHALWHRCTCVPRSGRQTLTCLPSPELQRRQKRALRAC
jgi:hypothetical protein